VGKDGTGVDSAPEGDLGGSLLSAKLAAPPVRPGTVSRGAVIESAKSSGRRIVGVTAPAGYGKTTLLAEWAASEDRPVAWVSLDRFDDDAATLMFLMAAAFVTLWPGDDALLSDMRGVGTSVLGRAAPRLASAFRDTPDPFVLMVDDLHELQSPDCHDALSVAMAGIPDRSQFVAASRHEQPHLPRTRASGEAVEIEAADLALDADGAQQIFSAASVDLTAELAHMIMEQTEGWPVGLYLAATIARDSPDTALSISGDDRFIADYLYRESLAREPVEVEQFLRRTSVLDHLSGPLCDAVLGGSSGQVHLRDLEASNQFLVTLDRRREWYRYHALYREFLAGELRRVEPALIPKLHLRAADWYEANGFPEIAVEHLLNTDERDRCVQLVTQLVLTTYQGGQVAMVERWLTELGDAAIEDYPPLAVLAGWITVLAGDAPAARRWAAVLDASSFDAVAVDGSASFESARAMLQVAMAANGVDRMLADARFAVASEPAWSPWRGTALALLAEANLLVGDVHGARAALDEAAAIGPTQDNADNFVMGQGVLAQLAMDAGQWDEASEHVQLALGAVEEHRMHDYPTSIRAYSAAARLAMHRGQPEQANRELTRAMRVRPFVTSAIPFLAVGSRLELARVFLSMNDLTSARHLLREVDDLLLERPGLGVLVDQTAELHEILASSADLGVGGASPLSPAELRLLPYLQTHLTFREIAERLYVSRNTVSSQVTAIYRKLGVSSRTEAVDQAMAVGLIGH
jgi:LuxR family transcriptional regulator, maltose regulon positive regulatory protein